MGSQFYASHPLVPLAQTDAAIILDLVGSQLWPGYSGHFAMGSEKSREVAQAVAAVPAPPGLILIQPGIHLVEETAYGHQPWSDYDAFRNQGVPFLFLSDGQNKDYHDVTDEASRLDFPKLTLEANWLLDVTWTLTNAAKTPVFDAAGADHLRDASAIIAVLEAALAPGGMVDSLGLSRTAKRRLSSDLRDVKSVRSRLLRGGTASAADIAALRRGTQRVMCYAGPQYPETICDSAF